MAPLLLAKTPPLAPPHDLLSPSPWEQQGWILLAISLAVFAIAGLAWWRSRRSKPVPGPSPEQQLHQALESWRDRPVDAILQADVSELLRRFVIVRFGLPPEALTTEELELALAGRPEVGADCRQAISQFLRESDYRRFSSPPQASPKNLVLVALELLDKISLHGSAHKTSAGGNNVNPPPP